MKIGGVQCLLQLASLPSEYPHDNYPLISPFKASLTLAVISISEFSHPCKSSGFREAFVDPEKNSFSELSLDPN